MSSAPGGDGASTRHVDVDAASDGVRLDIALATLLGGSRSQAAALIDAGLVEVDGMRRPRAFRVSAGERVTVAERAVPEARPTPDVPPVRFEDDDMLVLAKPAGLVVHPGAGRASGTLVDALRASGRSLSTLGEPERPGIVHRLDRDTSGLMMVAKSDRAHEALVAALAGRVVERRYLGLVEGVPAAAAARVDAPLGRDPRRRTRFAVVPSGKHAVTTWEVRAVGRAPGATTRAGAVALLSLRLETGRTHQVRVHCAFAGHPIVADGLYGGHADVAAAVGLTRPFLHACALAFPHPLSGERVELEEPLPDELERAAVLAGISEDARHP